MPDHSNYMTTIEQMRQSVLAAKGQAGVLAGLVALLENAPDSSMMAKGLDGIDPALYTDNALRLKVAGLLRDAEETEFAKLWDPTTPQSLPENVVSFSARKASDIIAEQKQVVCRGPRR